MTRSVSALVSLPSIGDDPAAPMSSRDCPVSFKETSGPYIFQDATWVSLQSAKIILVHELAVEI